MKFNNLFKKKKAKNTTEKNKTPNRDISREQQSTTYDDNENDENDRIEESFHQIKIENESLKNEIGHLRDEMVIKDQELENMKRNKQGDETKHMELKRKHADQIEEIKQKYDDQNNKFEELKQKYNDQKVYFEELKQKREILKQKYDNQHNNFEELKQKYAGHSDDFEKLKRKYADQNNKFEEIKQKYDDQSCNFEELNKKYKDQKESFEELKQKRDEQILAFEVLKQKYDDQNSNFEKLKQKYEDQNNKFEELNRKYNNQNDSFEELRQKYKDQNNNFQELKQKRDEQIVAFEIFKQKYKDQDDNFEELKQKYEDQNLAFEELKQKYKEQITDLDELKQQKVYFESQYNKSEQLLKEKNSQIKSLKQKNNDLEDEASKYQSALGIATNFDFNVDDQNNNVKLNQDILSLQDILENFVTNLKPKINVNINEVRKLLLKYGCQSKISDKEPNKPLIKAVLQRYVLEEILYQAYFYFINFKDSNKDHYLESNIVSQATVLKNLMEEFYKKRLGDDEITRITPIRLRQQIYTALGTRGFNNIRKDNGEISKHDSIDIISNHINKVINKYRIINDVEKRRYVNALAEDLVRNVIRIFYFRLPIQEPMAQCHWFKNNEKINKSCMKGIWDEDEIEDMVVEVCSFPLIYKPEDDGDKICTPAKVFPIHSMKEQSLGEKLMDMGMSLGRFINLYPSNGDSIQQNPQNRMDMILTELI